MEEFVWRGFVSQLLDVISMEATVAVGAAPSKKTTVITDIKIEFIVFLRILFLI